MKINKCKNNHYTLEDTCDICKEKASSAHYKFIKIRDVKDIYEKNNNV